MPDLLQRGLWKHGGRPEWSHRKRKRRRPQGTRSVGQADGGRCLKTVTDVGVGKGLLVTLRVVNLSERREDHGRPGELAGQRKSSGPLVPQNFVPITTLPTLRHDPKPLGGTHVRPLPSHTVSLLCNPHGDPTGNSVPDPILNSPLGFSRSQEGRGTRPRTILS